MSNLISGWIGREILCGSLLEKRGQVHWWTNHAGPWSGLQELRRWQLWCDMLRRALLDLALGKLLYVCTLSIC